MPSYHVMASINYSYTIHFTLNLHRYRKECNVNIVDNKFTIACGNKSLEVIEIQKEGKNKLLLKEFLRGINFKEGENLK